MSAKINLASSDPLAVIAAAKFIKDAALTEARTNAFRTYAVGEPIKVDRRFHVFGTIKQNPREPYRPTAEIPPIPTLMLFVDKIKGIVQESQLAKVEQALTDSMVEAARMKLTGTEKRELFTSKLTAPDSAMEKVQEILSALPDKWRDGKMLTNLDYELIPA